MAASYSITLARSWTRAVPRQAAGAAAASPAAVRLAVPVPTWHRQSTVCITAKKGSRKTKAPNKADIPSKVCATCGRLFTWRKKWEQVWDDVKYCSDRCRSHRPKDGSAVHDSSGQ
eukprot:GHRQ01028539.1.p1 GENE.GHRQ01028539.1~~GHRQ01028539.1.p1  ORF type:complete len:116 (+),score=20.61 GHRQ01028539.1:296-643(+)